MQPETNAAIETRPTRRAPSVLLCLVLAAVTLAVFWPAGGHEFVHYDDPLYVTSNPPVQGGLTPDGAAWALRTGHASNWHPLTWLSHMLDVELFGRGATGPHWINVLFHTANTLLLFLLLRELTGAYWRSAFVAALFGLHPLHVESVAWVSERKDVLSALFGLLTLWAYGRYAAFKVQSSRVKVQGPQFGVLKWRGLALLFFALGLMSKPMLATLPFVMLLFDWWPLQRFATHNSRATLWRLVREKFPFFGLSALSCTITFTVQEAGGAVSALEGLPLAARLGNALVAYARYLGKAFWPTDLAVFYPHPGHWPWVSVLLAALLVAALSIGALAFARQLPFLTTGWFWFLGMLVPVLGLVQVGLQSMADRYTYLPLIGLFIVVAWGAGEAIARCRLGSGGRLALAAAGVSVLAACATRTSDQLRYWRNGETLFRHAIAVTRNNYVAHNLLGVYLADNGRGEEAIAEYRRALAIKPDYADAVSNWGLALAEDGRVEEAIDYYRRALQIAPNHALSLANLAGALAGREQYAEAIAAYEAALRIRPGRADVHNALGSALVGAGRTSEAIQHYEEALRLAPNYAEAHHNLGRALASQHKPAEAVAQFKMALAERPDFFEVHNDLGSALIQLGRLDEAIRHFRLLLQTKPDHAGAYDNLGIALAMQGRLDEALVQFREALRHKPTEANTHFNLGNALALQGRRHEAIQCYTEAVRLSPTHAQAHNNLGYALAEQGRREEAVAHLREALRLKPDYAEARQQLRALGVETPK